MSKAFDEQAPDHLWIQGDAAPSITEQLLDGAGNPVVLTGATVRYVLRSDSGDAPAIDAAATVVDPLTGMVSFTPTALQTAAWGTYLEVWRVTFTGGAVETFPAYPHKVRIRKGTHTTP